MNRVDSHGLVWALVNAAKPFHSEASQAWLCVKIGSGDRDDAIFELLRFLADQRAELPSDLAHPLREWASGYVGTDREVYLRDLLDEVGDRVGGVSATLVRGSRGADPWTRRARRVSSHVAYDGDNVSAGVHG